MFGYKPETSNRQPVVLYDKDNKAIDVSGIEELSSVKIDTGEIAGDLKLVKDNQGRLYGKYGEAWIPVKVDSEGRPIISSDVTVNAEGMVVDLGQIKQGPAGTEPWPVQLSGTLTELFGESLSDRPPANSVSVGATFMVVGDTVVYQSNGTDWVVISE